MKIFTQRQIFSKLKSCHSVLDVGCGSNSCLKLYKCDRLVGIDGYLPEVLKSIDNHTHDTVICGNVCNLNLHFHSKEFDACVALDVIEHLSKESSLKLLADMERIASCKVIVFTPNGFLPQESSVPGDMQMHLSGWTTEEFRTLGYKVEGVLGPKYFRGEYHNLKYNPKIIWGCASLFGQLFWNRWFPKYASALLCVKNLY